jgi:hypothetical protein
MPFHYSRRVVGVYESWWRVLRPNPRILMDLVDILG